MSKIIICIFLGLQLCAAQKTNPVIFAEIYGGFAAGSSSGWTGGFDLNYQYKKDLLTVRYLRLTGLRSDPIVIGFAAFPSYKRIDEIHEYAILYGKRYIRDNKSYSCSVGIAKMNREFLKLQDGLYVEYAGKYIGVPFECNVKWFKPEKKRIRLYGILPVGKPTAIGASFGFKFFGTISKTSYVGAGISLGYGYHKQY
ncbi:MAG TPA: hypothetical protein VF581_05680 [Flavobacterium sp.]|jgi:hypothetical protein